MSDQVKLDLIKKAYTYGYPIVGMYELLFSQVLDPVKAVTGFNEFSHTAAVATPKTSFIPAPNNDTSYSRAWLDLRGEPVLIDTPDTNDRYYSIQLLDLFSETITNVGRRKNGTSPHTFAIIGPHWRGTLPQGAQPIHCKTTFAIAFLRVLIHGEQDIPEVKAIQQGFRIHRMNENSPALGKDLPVCDTEQSLAFFRTLNHVLALTPMLPEDAPILAELSKIGIGPNESLEPLKQLSKAQLDAAIDAARKEIDHGGLSFGEEVNFWRIAREGIGNYGTDYFQRSVVWYKGALANQPEESLYPSTFQDAQGEFLDGHHQYVLSFSKAEMPPVSQFWSLTLYRFSDAFLVENELDRYSIGDRTQEILYNKDGGLTLFIQSDAPSTAEQRANWLPAPKDKFFLTLRLYGAGKAALSGEWKPPAVRRINGRGTH